MTTRVDKANAEVGERVHLARERSGRPQRTIATSMEMQGHPWQQNTLTRVEAGARPLRLVEAVTLADILGVSVDYLLGAGQAQPSQAAAIRELTMLADYAAKRIAELS